MGDLISREAVCLQVKKLKQEAGQFGALDYTTGYISALSYVEGMIEYIVTVDAEPVRHGEWVESKGAIRCSECASTPLYDYHGRIVMSKACPNCGAKMDGDADG